MLSSVGGVLGSSRRGGCSGVVAGCSRGSAWGAVLSVNGFGLPLFGSAGCGRQPGPGAGAGGGRGGAGGGPLARGGGDEGAGRATARQGRRRCWTPRRQPRRPVRGAVQGGAGWVPGTDTVWGPTETVGDALAVLVAVLAALALGWNGVARAQPSVIATSNSRRAVSNQVAVVVPSFGIGFGLMGGPFWGRYGSSLATTTASADGWWWSRSGGAVRVGAASVVYFVAASPAGLRGGAGGGDDGCAAARLARRRASRAEWKDNRDISTPRATAAASLWTSARRSRDSVPPSAAVSRGAKTRPVERSEGGRLAPGGSCRSARMDAGNPYLPADPPHGGNEVDDADLTMGLASNAAAPPPRRARPGEAREHHAAPRRPSDFEASGPY